VALLCAIQSTALHTLGSVPDQLHEAYKAEIKRCTVMRFSQNCTLQLHGVARAFSLATVERKRYRALEKIDAFSTCVRWKLLRRFGARNAQLGGTVYACFRLQ
jgi:hypothetical protein